MTPNAPTPSGPLLPDGYKVIYEGKPLPSFYAAEMLQPYIGRTVWVKDSGGRVRNGELASVPHLKETDTDSTKAVEFTDERPLFLRAIVCIGVYEPPK